jgi:hypothetical protein
MDEDGSGVEPILELQDSRAQTEGSLATDIPFPRLPEELSVAIKISLPARQRARLSLDSPCRHSNWPVVYSCTLLAGFSHKKVPHFHLTWHMENSKQFASATRFVQSVPLEIRSQSYSLPSNSGRTRS